MPSTGSKLLGRVGGWGGDGYEEVSEKTGHHVELKT